MRTRVFARDPSLFESGDGVQLSDVDGKEYVDRLSGVCVTSLGYRSQAVIDAGRSAPPEKPRQIGQRPDLLADPDRPRAGLARPGHRTPTVVDD